MNGKKLLDQVVDKIRVQGYNYKTEKSYCSWIKRYILFHQKKHPATLGKEEIEIFLIWLALERNVSPSTQNQAFNALLFLYEQVLDIPLKNQGIQAIRAKAKLHVPVVLSPQDIKLILFHMCGGSI